MASDLTPPSSDDQRSSPDEGSARSTALVHVRDEAWFVDISGDPPQSVPSQVDGILLAAEMLRGRGGGQLLIRERGGGPYKRVLIEGSRS